MSYTGRAWFVPTVLIYAVPSYTTELFSTPYPMTRYEMLSEALVDAKVRAIEEYESQVKGSFNPSDMARAHARYIGAKVADGHAEEFAVVRDVVA
jgi:hypothetical protein